MDFSPLINYFNQHITLTPEEEDILSSKLILRTYLKNQYIQQQGDVCKLSNFIVSGCTKTFHVDKEGNEHVVLFSVENWWTSDIASFIDQTPADYNIQCLEKTTVIQFTRNNREGLFKELPRLEYVFRTILERALIASQKRIVNNFSLTAKERYLQFKQMYPKIEQRVPQYAVASYLGITKEFLSKVKRQIATE